MTAQIALWVLSTVGAVVFFGLGWVSSVMRRPVVQSAGQATAAVPGDEALRQADRDALEQALAKAASLAADRDELARVLDAERGKQHDVERLTQMLQAAQRRHEQDKQSWQDRVRADADALHAQIAELRAAASKAGERHKTLELTKAALDAARAEAAKRDAAVSVELDALRTKLRAAEAEAIEARRTTDALREVRAQLEAERERTKELDRLREQLTALREQSSKAAGADKERAGLAAALQSAKLELTQAQHRIEEMQRERDELRAVRDENERLRAEVAHAADVEREDKLLRQRTQAAEARGVEADELREQNRHLRDQLQELERFEKEAKQVASLDAELRSAKLDNELLRRRLEELGSDSASRLELVQKLEDAMRRAQEADALQRRVDALEARVFAMGASVELDVASVRMNEGHPTTALEEGPGSLIRAGAKTSVLADNAGLPLASAGLQEHHESLAALSGLALEFAARVTSLLPLSAIRLVQLVDERQMTVYWTLFDSHGDCYALSGVGSSMPEPALLNDAVHRAQGAVNRAGGFA